MQLPKLNAISKTREMISDFNGYNGTLRVPENQFAGMQNLTSDYYPVFSPRSKRGSIKTLLQPNGLFAKEALYYVEGPYFCENGTTVGSVFHGPKLFAGMGAYILILPDMKIYNTITRGIFDMQKTWYCSVEYEACDQYGNFLNAVACGSTEPTKSDGRYWIDTSKTKPILKKYEQQSDMWKEQTPYTRLTPLDLDKFTELITGDTITISGATIDESMPGTNTDITMLNGEFPVVKVIDGGESLDSFVINLCMPNQSGGTGNLTIIKTVPGMDYATELNNRLWGCSSANHEIYASALGDPYSWRQYAGISTDSYAVTVGSDGDFTGACTFAGQALFFKEDTIHKIYGSQPSNFQLVSTVAPGVEKGSEKSLVTVNGILYYKGKDGIYAYDGSYPVKISADLGAEQYSNAVAGAYRHKYYVSMSDSNGNSHLFVYDTLRGMWHREDDTKVKWFAYLGGELYYINADDRLCSIGGTIDIRDSDGALISDDAALEDAVQWCAETGDIGTYTPDHKYISQLQVRLSVDIGSIVKIAFQYDSSGVWEERYSITATQKKAFTVPIIPKRCDHLRIRFSGVGDCKIYSVTKTIEKGGV